MTIGLKNLYIGLLTNANVAVYTPPGTGGVSAKINSASAYNDDTNDLTVDIYIVATGGAGAAAASNQIYNDKVIPAKSSIDLDLLRGKNIIGTGSLVAKASSTNLVTIAVSGLEVS
jgi:hypothetical protein